MNSIFNRFLKRKSFGRYVFMPVLLLLFFVIFYFLYSASKQNTIREFNNEQLILAKTASQGISSLLDNYLSVMSFIVKYEEIIDFSEEGEKVMKDFYDTHKSVFNAITRVDATGNILHTLPYKPTVIGRNIASQAHVEKVIATQEPVISDVFMSVQGYYAIALHVPIFNDTSYTGSLALLIPIDELGRLFLDNIKPNKKGHAWLITENYTEIYCPVKGHQGKSMLENSTSKENRRILLEKIKKNSYGTGKIDHCSLLDENEKGEDMYVVFHRAPHGNTYWTTLISYQESEVYSALSQFRNRLIFVLFLLFIAVAYYVFSLLKVKNILKEEAKRRKAEEQLKESNACFNSFMENTSIYAYIKDHNLNIIYHNRKVTSLLPDQHQKEVYAKDFFEKEIVELIEEADRQILSGEKTNVELVFSANIDGKNVWLKNVKFRISMSNNQYAVGGAIFDITEIKNYEKELEEHQYHLKQLVEKRTTALQIANSELERLNHKLKEQNKEVESTLSALKEAQSRLVQSEKMASLGVLTAGISHEINNPLQYLSGVHYALEEYFKKYGSQDLQTTDLLLSSTETSIDRISTIVNGLNQLSRENRNFNEDCDIHSVLDSCLTVLLGQYKYKVEIERQFNSNPIVVQGNVGQLHQVFINVLMNAIQAIENKGKITIVTYLKAGYAIIEIIDTGQGIEREHLAKIIDPFFTTKDPGKGTGLGLSICYSILKDHHGQIDVESEINKGTKVVITLLQ